jgi:hypothetical protein
LAEGFQTEEASLVFVHVAEKPPQASIVSCLREIGREEEKKRGENTVTKEPQLQKRVARAQFRPTNSQLFLPSDSLCGPSRWWPARVLTCACVRVRSNGGGRGGGEGGDTPATNWARACAARLSTFRVRRVIELREEVYRNSPLRQRNERLTSAVVRRGIRRRGPG